MGRVAKVVYCLPANVQGAITISYRTASVIRLPRRLTDCSGDAAENKSAHGSMLACSSPAAAPSDGDKDATDT